MLVLSRRTDESIEIPHNREADWTPTGAPNLLFCHAQCSKSLVNIQRRFTVRPHSRRTRPAGFGQLDRAFQRRYSTVCAVAQRLSFATAHIRRDPQRWQSRVCARCGSATTRARSCGHAAYGVAGRDPILR
jgi:hypothetical protein